MASHRPDVLDSINRLEGPIASGRATPTDMAALANILTTAQSTVTALETASWATAAARAAEQLAAASVEARTTVHTIMAGMHEFDDQLRFASADDRRDYRGHEAERRA